MVQAAYGLWLARNDARDGKKISAPHEIIESVCSYMQEWQNTNEQKMRQPKCAIIQRWEPPDEGWVKVNSDGAVARGGGNGGGGAVLRDHNAGFLAGACHFFRDVGDPEAAEIIACKKALQVARERGVQKVHLELDSKGVVQMIRDRLKNLAAVGPWIQEIKVLLSTFSDFKV